MPSQNNALQGDFGEAWLEAVAAGCGFLHGRPATLDLEKADVQLTLLGRHQGTFNPTVKVQVKTGVELRSDADGSLVYKPRLGDLRCAEETRPRGTPGSGGDRLVG